MTDYPVSDVVWTTLVLVAVVLFLGLVIRVLTDVFRRDDHGYAWKAAWTLCVICVPVAGMFAYLIANGDRLASRRARNARHGVRRHSGPRPR